MKFILLIVFVGISALSFGFLSNNMAVTIQPWALLALPPTDPESSGIEEFTTFNCECEGAPCNVDYTDAPTNTIPDPASLGAVGNQLCT